MRLLTAELLEMRVSVGNPHLSGAELPAGFTVELLTVQGLKSAPQWPRWPSYRCSSSSRASHGAGSQVSLLSGQDGPPVGAVLQVELLMVPKKIDSTSKFQALICDASRRLARGFVAAAFFLGQHI